MATIYGTSVIRRRHAENIFHAVRYAKERGRPLNTLVTINFADLGVPLATATRCFQRLNERVVRWWRYERSKGHDIGTFDSVHAHANPHERRHVHWLIHAPAFFRLRLEATIFERLAKIAGRRSVGDALDVREITNCGTLAKYVLRGTEPAFADYFHMRTSDEGPVIGRRTGAGRSIGRAARREAGWNRKPRRGES